MSWPTSMIEAPICLLNAPQGLDDLALHHDVERAGRLIGDDHPRAQADRDRDHHPLFHPAAEFVRISVGDLRLQSDGRQQFADPRVERRARQRLAVVAQRVGELAADARHRIEGIHRALRHQRDRRQTQGAHLFLGKSEKVVAFEQRLAAFDPPRRLDQAASAPSRQSTFPIRTRRPIPAARLRADRN